MGCLRAFREEPEFWTVTVSQAGAYQEVYCKQWFYPKTTVSPPKMLMLSRQVYPGSRTVRNFISSKSPKKKRDCCLLSFTSPNLVNTSFPSWDMFTKPDPKQCV